MATLFIHDFEADYIRRKHADKTVKEMAAALDVPEDAIYNYCNRYHLKFKKQDDGKNKIIQAERIARLQNNRAYIPDAPPKKIVRPPAVYGNIPSPLGLATELHHSNHQKCR